MGYPGACSKRRKKKNICYQNLWFEAALSGMYVHTIQVLLHRLAEHHPIRHRSHEPQIESGRARSRNNTALADSYRSFMFSLNPNLSQVFGFSQIPFFFFLFFSRAQARGFWCMYGDNYEDTYSRAPYPNKKGKADARPAALVTNFIEVSNGQAANTWPREFWGFNRYRKWDGRSVFSISWSNRGRNIPFFW